MNDEWGVRWIMEGLVNLLSFGMGTFCLGGGLVVTVLFSMSRRHSEEDTGEGCFGNFLLAFTLLITFFFFVMAAGGA
jgi:hypothetical protein